MILKASQRSGAKQLGLHLMKTEENEHVEIHEVSGFVDDSLMGAMKEAYALSLGTKCRQHLFSVSLNPPAGESVRVEVFEHALKLIEERNGLTGQPRVVVFHEKEGRRHCHAVWSRIDAETMTAKPLPHFKMKLRDIAKQLYLENGWQLPKGFIDWKLRDPRSFTLDEWQQGKRAGIDPQDLRTTAQECWAASDSASSFTTALEERGLFLARGDRRGHVVVTIDGEVYALSRLVDRKGKDVEARLGSASTLLSVEQTVAHVRGEVGMRLRGHITEAKRLASVGMKPLVEKRDQMKFQHQKERQDQAKALAERANREARERSARVRGGVKGVWDILTGRYFKVRKQNEVELFFSKQRDREQRHALVQTQLAQRGELQSEIKSARRGFAERVLRLYQHAAQYRRMEAGRSRDRGLELG